MNKKLLFIEDQVLRHDQSAGARTSYMYLHLLVEMGISVTFIGCDFKRIEPYTGHLRSLGVKVLTGKWYKYAWRIWFLLFVRNFDYVFFNRPYPTKCFIDYVKIFSNAKTMYQCHDLHYLRLLRQYEVDGNKENLENARYFEKLEIELIQKSDVFLTFSQHEKEIIEKKSACRRSEAIPLYFYESLTPPITDFSQRGGILFVGGFLHPPNVDAVLWFVREILPEIKKSRPELIFYIVGNHPPDEITKLSGTLGIDVLGYVTDEELVGLYKKVRMVVVPLRFGAGVKGKTVEAIHYSLPLVSTGIGIEGIGLESVVTPMDDAKAFANRVVTLYEDEATLRRFSSQLHDYAGKNLSKTAAKEKLESILDSLDHR